MLFYQKIIEIDIQPQPNGDITTIMRGSLCGYKKAVVNEDGKADVLNMKGEVYNIEQVGDGHNKDARIYIDASKKYESERGSILLSELLEEWNNGEPLSVLIDIGSVQIREYDCIYCSDNGQYAKVGDIITLDTKDRASCTGKLTRIIRDEDSVDLTIDCSFKFNSHIVGLNYSVSTCMGGKDLLKTDKNATLRRI